MNEWTDLEPEAKKAPPKAPVRFGLSTHKGARRARGVILLRKEVIDQLELATWRVRVRVGSGARGHQIAIMGDPAGPFELYELGIAKGGGVYRLTLPVVDRWPDMDAIATERPFKVEREGRKPLLVIDLPAFCFDAHAAKRALQRMEGAKAA